MAAKLAVVTQDALLFHGSIADNIVLGDDTPIGLGCAVRRKRRTCWSLRKRCPKGWTPKWGTARQAQRGQRQRVALARALYRDADVLLLGRGHVRLGRKFRVFGSASAGTSRERENVVVIAHRMSTIREADTIAVLEGGQVVEQGTHDELMAMDGRYAELDQLQRRG